MQQHNHSNRLEPLQPAASLEQYQLHLAALEWSLDAPIIIRSEAEIQSKRRWQGRLKPYAHQIENLMVFCRRSPVALLADDVGLGKTISAGLILSELMERRKVKRALVLAPNLLLPQWVEELGTKFDIAATSANGSDVAAAARGRVPVVVTTYHSMRSYATELRAGQFDMVILDEAHKLRNLHPNPNPPQFAMEVRRALEDQAFRYVLMLTATPIQNRLWDIYSLIDLLTAAKKHRNPFGEPHEFRSKYISDPRGLSMNPMMREVFRRHVGNYVVRTRRADARLAFPTRRVQTRRVAATEAEDRIADLVSDLFQHGGLNGLEQTSIGQAFMSGPEALLEQLQKRSATDHPSRECLAGVKSVVERGGDSAKLDALVKLIAELATARPEDWRVVVFTSRIATLEAIRKRLTGLGHAVGYIKGGAGQQTQQSLRNFRSTPPQVRVIVSTDAGAEGVNLQAANVLVNYDLPWNPMVLEQRIGRVQRLASNYAEVQVLNLVLAGSVEERVVARLTAKLQAIAESLGDLEAILESATSDDDAGQTFESIIRNLVVGSLRQRDNEEAIRLADESIERGKQIFEDEKATVERTLGDLRDLLRAGPDVPEIEPRQPSMQAPEFVLAALTHSGARFKPRQDELLEVQLPGSPSFLLTFSEEVADEYRGESPGVFGGNAPRLYLPGKRDFERLAQSWADRAASAVSDQTRVPPEFATMVLEKHFAGDDGIRVIGTTERSRKTSFTGELICRASAAVRHDRIEDLVTLPCDPPGGWTVDSAMDTGGFDRKPFDPGVVSEFLTQRVFPAIRESSNIRKFCQFYEARLSEELPKAESSAARDQIRETFQPTTGATLVGARGAAVTELDVRATLEIDGVGIVECDLTVRPSAREQDRVGLKSPWRRCEVSGRLVPEEALCRCEVSGGFALKHLMAKSEASGRLALPHATVIAADSGRRLLPDETVPSAISGCLLDAELAVRSAVSNAPALDEELEACQVTHVRVLPSELLESEISGRKFRVDQGEQSVLSRRIGHCTEFVESVLPPGKIATDEADQSDLSGAYAAAGQIGRSSKPPFRRGLFSELAPSHVSGRLFLTDELEASAVSGKRALPEELVACAFTGTRVLPSEAGTSDISAKLFRADESRSSDIGGRTGHRSEFVRSVHPSGWVASDEAGQSDLSSAWGSKAALRRSDKSPHRQGFPAEVVRCEASGQTLLTDEVGQSEVSGKLVDSQLLRYSAATRRRALDEELVTCELRGLRLLPDEVQKCAITGKTVDKRLVEASQESGIWGLQSEMVTCVLSGKRLLPAETTICAIVRAPVALSATEPCAVTGRRATRKHMSRCASSGRLYIDDQASVDTAAAERGVGPLLRPDEWLGGTCLVVAMAKCALSGLQTRVDQLNRAGELTPLRELLDGRLFGGSRPLSDERLASLQPLLREIGKPASGFAVIAPRGDREIGCVLCKTGFMRLSSRTVGYGIATDGSVLFPTLVGRVGANGWERTKG